jgi:hypothetical protein
MKYCTSKKGKVDRIFREFVGRGFGFALSPSHGED